MLDELVNKKVEVIQEDLYKNLETNEYKQNSSNLILNKQNNNGSCKKKFFRVKNFNSLISSDSFTKNKLCISDLIFGKGPVKYLISNYKYEENNNDLLVIQTPFLDIKKNIFYKDFKDYNNLEKKFEIKFNPNFFDKTLLDIFINYDDRIAEIMKKKCGNEIRRITKLIFNKKVKFDTPQFEIIDMNEELGLIKAKFKHEKKLTNYSKLINYNVSKNYPKKEEFDFNCLNTKDYLEIFNRILTQHKQIRLLLSPITWINESEKIYGSYLNIFMMEVKYDKSKIHSLLDVNQISMKKNIIGVEI